MYAYIYTHTDITMDDLLHSYSEKYQNTANEKFIKECRCLLFTLFILDFYIFYCCSVNWKNAFLRSVIWWVFPLKIVIRSWIVLNRQRNYIRVQYTARTWRWHSDKQCSIKSALFTVFCCAVLWERLSRSNKSTVCLASQTKTVEKYWR